MTTSAESKQDSNLETLKSVKFATDVVQKVTYINPATTIATVTYVSSPHSLVQF